MIKKLCWFLSRIERPAVIRTTTPLRPRNSIWAGSAADFKTKVKSPAGTTLPCQRTSSGSVKLPVQAPPLWAAAGLTPAEAASNPRATITKIRLRLVFMLKFLPQPDFRLILYALPLGDTRSREHLTGREGGMPLRFAFADGSV